MRTMRSNRATRSESLPGELLAAQTAAEAVDRRFVFHPFTQLDEHQPTGSPR